MSQSLTNLRFDILGIRFTVDPPALTVPKDIPTFVTPVLTLPTSANADAQAAVTELAHGAAVVAELRGPELTPTTLTTLPGEPLRLPPFRIPGDYFLDNIRLVRDGVVLLAGDPQTVRIKVISDILISNVTTRELSLDEIRSRGIVVDERNFRVLEFQAAFVIDGKPVTINFPTVLPQPPQRAVPGVQGYDFAFASQQALQQQQRTIVELPPELDMPGLNLYLVGAEFVQVEAGDAEEPRLGIPPIPALIAIPGHIGYLNQFFSALVMVQNGAPDGSALVVRDISAQIVLPKGLDQVVGTDDAPGDDPLRLARTAAGSRAQVPVTQRGPDGEPGTSDDLAYLAPGQTGEGEFLIEGLREGTHVFDVNLNATLVGLPSGPVALAAQTQGTVLVSNPTFALSLSQPHTVRAGEPYDLYATVTNTSDRTVNLVSITLDRRAVSGAQLLSDETVLFETLAPFQAATARFHLLAQTTGEVTFTQITAEPGISANFSLRTGVDERGVPLSPNALVLPKPVDRLPEALVLAAQRVLGQAFSVATAPQLPPGVRYIPRSTVFARGRELAEIGTRLVFNEPLVRGLHDLLLDWSGNRLGDPGFEQLLRTTEAGATWVATLGGLLGAELANHSVLDVQAEFAATAVARTPSLSLALGDGSHPVPARLRLTNPLNQALDSDLPFAQTYPLATQDDRRALLAVVSRLNQRRYTVEITGTAAGQTDVGLVIPTADGEFTQFRFTAVPLAVGSRALLDVNLDDPTALSLRLDTDGDGRFESSRPPDTSQLIRDGPPQVVAARSLTDVSEAFVYNSPSAHLGLLVDVLFNKPVTAESAQTESHYTIPNNAAADAILQPTGRIATLYLAKPIGALLPRTLTVQGISDASGRASAPQTLPINDLLDDGARLLGQVRRADGRPVANAIVQISAYAAVPPRPCECPLAQLTTDTNGYFDLDFVRKTLSAYFRVTAIDPVSGEQASVQDRVRFVGATQTVNPVFFGRGRVVGRVLLPDGVTSAGTAAVNLFPDYYRTGQPGRGLYSSADGTFAFEDVPVGRFTLKVEVVEFRPNRDGDLIPYATGQFATVTDVVRESGETVTVTAVTTVRPTAGTGNVQGRVFLSDGVTPAVNFPVFLGGISTPPQRQIQAYADTTTDSSGGFRFDAVPAQSWTVIAVDPGPQVPVTAQVVVRPDETTAVNLSFGATGSVRVIVRDASGNLVANALVAGGYALVRTDANGVATIPELPVGTATVAAGSETTRRTGSNNVDIFPGQTSTVEVRLIAAADITGRVTDTAGQPVRGALVRIPIPGAGYFKATSDANGIYLFPNMGLGDYTVSAQGGSGTGIPLSQDEVAERLTSDMSDALRSRELATIRAAFQQALEVFVGSSSLLTPAPAATPGFFGFTRVRSGIDGVAAIADIQYLPVGSIGGVTVDGNDLPTKAAMQVRGLGLDELGSPGTRSLGFFNSDAVTGAFSFPTIPYGDYTVSAARPFSSVILTRTGTLGPGNPDDNDLILKFPPADPDNVLVGTVFQPDGVTPVGADVPVHITFGDLTPRTGPDGRFDAQIPLPDGSYVLTATDPLSTLTGQAQAVLRGNTVDVPIRLLGRTTVRIRVERPDGTAVPGAAVTLEASTFPRDRRQGTTGGDGSVTFVNLSEGYYGALAVEGDQLSGRAGLVIAQADALAQREVGATVVLRGFGTITGTFLAADGVTPIADGLISLHVEGVAEVRGLGAAAAVTTSDSTGRFRYERVPVGNFRLVGENPANLRLGETRGRLVNQNAVVDVVLQTGALGQVAGTVLDATGSRVIPGAAVSLAPTSIPRPSDAFPWITAGTNGDFNFAGVPAGPFTVRAYDPISGFFGEAQGTVSSESQTVRADVHIQAYGTLTGTVYEPGSTQPATNVNLTIGTLRSNQVIRHTGVTDQGRFSAERLPLGNYEIRAQKNDPVQGLNGQVVTVELTAPDQVLEVPITLRGVGTVVVNVVDANGTPVPTADVMLSAHAPFGREFNNFTGSDGSVSFPGIPVGAFDVRAQSSTLRVGGAISGTLTTHGETVTVTVTLGEAGVVAGRLVLPDANATPVPGAFVTLDFRAQTQFGGTLQVLTDALGLFRFAPIPFGDFRLDIVEPLSQGRRRLSGNLSSNGQVADFGNVVLDLAAPQVVATVPADGAVGVNPDQVLTVAFSEAIVPDSVQFSQSNGAGGNVYLADAAGNQQRATVQVAADAMSFTITPESPLASETRYQLVLRNGTDAIRDAAADRVLQDPFVLSFSVRDTVPPRLLSQTPVAGASGIAAEAVVRLTFDEAMAETTTLRLSRNGLPVAGTLSRLFGNTVLVFTPTQPLALNALYIYTLSNATDLAGNPLADVSASFQTLDTQGPTIAALNLVGTPSGIAGTAITVQPSVSDADLARVEYTVNAVPVATVTTAPYAFTTTLPSSSGVLRIGATGIDTSGNRGPLAVRDVTVIPNQPPVMTLVGPPSNVVGRGQTLTFQATASDDVALQTLTLSAVGAVQQSQTLNLAGQRTFSGNFNVTVPNDAPSQGSFTVQLAATDSTGQVGVSAALTRQIGDTVLPTVRFVSPVEQAVVLPGQRVDVTVTASDDVAVTALTLACVPNFPACGGRTFAPTASRSETFSLELPASLTAPFTIALTASALDSAGNISLLAGRTLRLADTVPPVVTALNSLSGSNRVDFGQAVAVRAQATDNVAVSAVEFRTAGVLTTATTVQVTPATSPANAEFNFTVPANATGSDLTVFARALDAAGNRSDEQSFSLQVGDFQPPTVVIEAPAGGTSATPGQTLTLRVTASDDVAVRTIRFSTSGAFSTTGERHFTPPLTPAQAQFSINVPTDAVPGPLDLTVTALDARNTSTPVVRRVTVIDNVPPVVTVVSPAAGTVIDPRDPPPVVVRATDNLAVAELSLALSGLLSRNEVRPVVPPASPAEQTFTLDFASLPPVGGNVTLTAGARDGAGNVAAAAVLTLAVQDVVVPEVSSTIPTAGATAVDPDSTVTVQFSEPVERTSVASRVRLTANGSELSVTLSFSDSDRRVILTPVNSLPLNTVITLSVAAGIADAAGNLLAVPFTATFTTASPDRVGPRVHSVFPVDGATGVSVATPIRVTFNEAVQPATVTASTFQVLAGVTPLTGSFQVNNTTVRFTPATLLPFATPITLRLTAGITDLAGNALTDANGAPLTGPLSFSFTTGAFTLTSPLDGTTVVENSNLILEARSDSGLGITQVVFTVNGQALPAVAGPSFSTTYPVPTAAQTPTLTIHASGRNATGTELASDQATVTVVVGLQLTPTRLGVPLGGSAGLTLFLSSPATEDVPITLSAANPALVNLPTTPLVLRAGESRLETTVAGVAEGNTTLLATSSRGIAAAIVSVSTPLAESGPVLAPPVGIVARPAPSLGQIVLPPNSQQTLPVPLLSQPATAPVMVTVISSAPNVATVTGTVIIPTGSQIANLPLSSGVAGTATLMLQFAGEVRELTVIVGTPPAGSLPPILAPPVGIVVRPAPTLGQVLLSPNAQQTVRVSLLAQAATQPVPVTVTSSDPAVASVNGVVTIPFGSQTVDLPITSSAAGTAILTLQFAGEVRELTVIVGTPPAGSIPPVLAPPVGIVALPLPSLGQVILAPTGQQALTVPVLATPATTATQVSFASSDSTVASVLEPVVIIAAGSQVATFTVVAGQAGEAILTVTTGSEIRELRVIIGPPPAGSVPPVLAPPVGIKVP